MTFGGSLLGMQSGTALGGVERAPSRILVVQTGADASQAKVFKAHAAPQGLFENLTNALELLANQQTDGDSPMQGIVTGLHEKSRLGIMKVRRFIEVDNRRAVEVGLLTEGISAFWIKKPKFEAESPDAIVREGPEESTLRAEEVGTPKSCININHGGREHPWSMMIGMHFAKRYTKRSWAASGSNCTGTTKRLVGQPGAKKPSDNQKAKSLWKKRAARDRERNFMVRTVQITLQGRKRRDWICGKSASKTHWWRWKRPCNAWSTLSDCGSCGDQEKQENVWWIDLGRHLALLGSEGLCAFARGSNVME